MAKKALIDFTDKELADELRANVEHLMHTPASVREEIHRRSQDKNTKALNRWTFVIAAATFVNAVATCILVLRVVGVL